MVKLEAIACEASQKTHNKSSSTSSSSSSSSGSSSPTSPLEITKMPPPLLPHQFHHPHPQPPTFEILPSYPPYQFYYCFYPNPIPYPVYYFPGQVQQPPPPPPPPPQFYVRTPTPPPPFVGPTSVGPRVGLYPKKAKPGRRIVTSSTTTTQMKVWKPKQVDSNTSGNNNNNNENIIIISKNDDDDDDDGVKKSEGNPKKEGKKIEGEDELANCTTIMLKNIPNKLSRNSLISMLDRHCRNQNRKKEDADDEKVECQYDFVYLPFDFLRGQNLGYAFINFTSAEGASTLYTCWNNEGWAHHDKIRAITRAKWQGLYRCRHHFETSVFYCKTDEFLPLEFSPPRNGFNAKKCKAKTIGRWVYHDSGKRAGEIRWWANSVHPPRHSRLV